MHPNEKLITKFYESFKIQNSEGMNSCYAEGSTFSDPVFQNLTHGQTHAMWTMLCKRAKGFELTFSNVKADDKTGSAHWEAKYLFSKTGRKVHNVIEAKFEFKDGKISKHEDSFDLWKWSGMALGLPGKLLGWTPFIQNKIRAEAMKGLGTGH